MTASVSIIDNRKSLRVSARRVSVSVSAQRRPMRLSINGGTPRAINVVPTVHPLRVSGPRLPLTLAQTQRIVLVSRGRASASGAGRFVHTQSTPQLSWTVYHALNTNPMVWVVVDGEVVECRVTYPNLESALLEFNSPTSGKAYCAG